MHDNTRIKVPSGHLKNVHRVGWNTEFNCPMTASNLANLQIADDAIHLRRENINMLFG